MHFARIKSLVLIPCMFAAVIFSMAAAPQAAHASFQQNNLMDASVFDNVNSMSESDIQNFLNGFPSSCLAHSQSADPLDYFDFGSNVPDAQVVYDAARYWSINP